MTNTELNNKTSLLKLLKQNFFYICCLSVLFVQNQTFSQPANGAVNPPPVEKNEPPKIDDEGLKMKLQAIEESYNTYEEKEKAKKDYLASMGLTEAQQSDLAPFSDITFQPKYFPTAILENWKSTVLVKNANALKNIVIVNEAYAIDYNNYFDKELDKTLAKLIEQNPLSEYNAVEYILPNFTILKNNNPNIKADEIVNLMKIYFAAKPDLYFLLPSSITRKMKNKNTIWSIYETQKAK